MLCLLKSKVQLASDMNIDLLGNDFGSSQGHFIDPVGSKVVMTASYWAVIAQMKTGTFRHYDKDLGHAKGNQLRATILAGYVPPIFSKCSHKVKAVQAQVGRR